LATIEPERLRCGEVHKPDVVTMNDTCAYRNCKQLRTSGSEWCLWHSKKLRPPQPGRQRHWTDTVISGEAKIINEVFF
jgi:hypothetical protein